jgi:hypothetical protein
VSDGSANDGGDLLRDSARKRAIDSGLAFLERRQLPSGEFPMWLGSDLGPGGGSSLDPCTFTTAHVVHSLGYSSAPLAREMVSRGLSFLQAEMQPYGVWKYWSRRHPGHYFIPPDVDDTASISYVLRRNGMAVPGNERLLLANRDRRGRFYTWIVPRWALPRRDPAYWRVVGKQLRSPRQLRRFWTSNKLSAKDVACVVNANVLLYLGDMPATKRVSEYLVNVMRRHEEAHDPWYRSKFAFYYAVSRCAQVGVRSVEATLEEVVARTLAAANTDGSIGANELETGLAACTLQNCRRSPVELEQAVTFLVAAQCSDGSWPIAPFYYDGQPDPVERWGSEELVTAFCLEALLRYDAVTSELGANTREAAC